MDEFGFEYLSIIKECMDKVYGEKPNLINQNGRRSSHEQSISFRLGYYLSDALKDKKGYFIDNEYTNDCDTTEQHNHQQQYRPEQQDRHQQPESRLQPESGSDNQPGKTGRSDHADNRICDSR